MFTLTIASVSDVLFHGEVTSVTLPGSEGEMTILKNHIPLVSALRSGVVTVRGVGGNETFPINKGVLEVSKESVLVLV
mgnify:CR=1 FL=1